MRVEQKVDWRVVEKVIRMDEQSGLKTVVKLAMKQVDRKVVLMAEQKDGWWGGEKVVLWVGLTDAK